MRYRLDGPSALNRAALRLVQMMVAVAAAAVVSAPAIALSKLVWGW